MATTKISNPIISGYIQQVASRVNKQLARQAWLTDATMRAAKVAKYREYVDGDFPTYLSADARNMLGGQEYSANYMDTIVQTMSDRLRLLGVNGQTEAATKWSGDVLEWNRIDGLQTDVHDAAIRDGDTYILVSWDNEVGMPVLTHELAFDGIDGMLVIHERTDTSQIVVAIKVWQITKTEYADTVRVNYYYPDRIERYIGPVAGAGGLVEFTEDGQKAVLPWQGGMPVIQFSNRKRGKGGFGISELEKAMPLQDGLNRTLNSMVMASELLAFGIRYMVGGEFPKNLRPGSVISIVPRDQNGVMKTTLTDNDVKLMQSVKVGTFEASDLKPFLDQSSYFVGAMRNITATPDQQIIAATASGEARKQAEAPLIGKVERFQIKGGNAWEETIMAAANVQRAYGRSNPPENSRWNARWKSAELRDNSEVVDNVLKLGDDLPKKWRLRLTAQATGLSDADIEAIIQEAEEAEEGELNILARLGSQLRRTTPTNGVNGALPNGNGTAVTAANQN